MMGSRAPGARRAIVRAGPERRTPRAPGLSEALLAAQRLESVAHRCQGCLAERDVAGVRTAIGLAFDAIEQIEAGLANEFPPRDPGRGE